MTKNMITRHNRWLVRMTIIVSKSQPLGYTYEYAYQFLLRLSEKGYELYTHVQLPLDLLYPALFGLTGICTIVLLVRLYAKVNRHSNLSVDSILSRTMLFVPVVAMFADYMENLFIYAMLSFKSAVPQSLVYAADLFTITKSIATTSFYMIVLIIGILIGVSWLGQWMRKEQMEG
jgi:branched-subunit amino acid transport protein